MNEFGKYPDDLKMTVKRENENISHNNSELKYFLKCHDKSESIFYYFT